MSTLARLSQRLSRRVPVIAQAVRGGRLGSVREDVRVERLDPRWLFDSLPPTAIASGEFITNPTAATTITVIYNDNDGINRASIGNGDIRVTAANGFSQLGTFLEVLSSDDTSLTATYSVTGPGGNFDRTDNGFYFIALVAGEVSDSVGNVSANGDLSSFTVAIPAQINSTGPISQISVTDSGRFQVKTSQFSRGQFYPSDESAGDAGIFVRIADSTGGTTTYGFRAQALTAVSQEMVGELSVKTVFDAASLLRIEVVTSYVPGDQFFSITQTVTNLTSNPLSFDLFFAADLYLADSDRGVGFFNPDTGAIGGTDVNGQYNIFFQGNADVGPIPTSYQEGNYSEVLDVPSSSSTHYNNTVNLPAGSAPYTNDPAYEDNGAGIEWQGISLAPQASTIRGLFAAFGNLTSAGGALNGSLSSVGTPRYGDATVDLQVVYTGTGGVNVSTFGNDDLTITGPNNFSATAAFLSSAANSDGSVVALYRAPAPSGGFLDTNNGDYTLTLNANAVRSGTGAGPAATVLGTFTTTVVKPTIGGFDASFGSGGRVTVTLSNATLKSIDSFRNADGTVLTAGYDATTGGLVITRFLDNGSLDTAFGNGGTTSSAAPSNFSPDRVQLNVAAGRIYLLGAATDSGQPGVAAYSLEGTLDGSFGNGGVLAVTPLQPGDRLDAFIAVPDKVGGYLAGGAFNRAGVVTAVVLRIDAAGALNTKFGNKGIYQRAAGGPLDTIGSITFGAKNAIFAAGTASAGSLADGSVSSRALVLSLTSAGKINKAFNKTGEQLFGASAFAISAGQKVTVQPDGKPTVVLALALNASTAAAGQFGAGFLRLTSKGTLDTSISGVGYQLVKSPDAPSVMSSRRVGALSAPTLDGEIGSVTDVLTAPQTMVDVAGGKVRQLAADDAGNGTTITQTQINVDALDLVANILTVTAKKPYKFNANVAASVSVANTGTLSSPKAVPVEVYLSADGFLDVSSDTLVGTLQAKLSLIAGKTKTLKIPVKAPGATGTYYVFARINSGAGSTAELTTGNNLATPSTGFVVTPNGKPLAVGARVLPQGPWLTSPAQGLHLDQTGHFFGDTDGGDLFSDDPIRF